MKRILGVLLLLGSASCNLTDDGGCSFADFKVSKIHQAFALEIPPDVDSVVFRDNPAAELITVPASDSIRFEFEITKNFRVTDTTVVLEYSIDTASRELYIRADFIHGVLMEQQGASVDCSPAPDHVDITHAKVFIPEGTKIKIGRTF